MRGCFTCPHHHPLTHRTGRGRKVETQALNTDTLRLVSSWHRHANASEKPCWRRRRTRDNFPPPSVSKWYYLLRHRLPDFVLLAAPKPSIRSPIGHRICDVSASVTNDFEQPHGGHPQDTDWTELRYTLKHFLLMLHGITFASAKAGTGVCTIRKCRKSENITLILSIVLLEPTLLMNPAARSKVSGVGPLNDTQKTLQSVKFSSPETSLDLPPFGTNGKKRNLI